MFTTLTTETSPLGIVYHYKEKMYGCSCMAHEGFSDSTISHFTGSSAPTDPWNITMVYDTGLVVIKALYELPQRYDPQMANINFIAAACITLAYNITSA